MIKLTTNHGAITLELFADKAPKTVANFIAYVESGQYDNTIFHRVIDGFMIQCGGFEPGMKQKEVCEPIENEAKNGLKNENGTIAMARTSDPHSATAQFFINVSDNDFLDNGRCQDGWRGVIAEDYTFDNVRRAAQGFASYMVSQGRTGQWVASQEHIVRFTSPVQSWSGQ